MSSQLQLLRVEVGRSSSKMIEAKNKAFEVLEQRSNKKFF
jgi:hypothetical protein